MNKMSWYYLICGAGIFKDLSKSSLILSWFLTFIQLNLHFIA